MDLSYLIVDIEVDAWKVDFYCRASYSKLPYSQLMERDTLQAMIQLICSDTLVECELRESSFFSWFTAKKSPGQLAHFYNADRKI